MRRKVLTTPTAAEIFWSIYEASLDQFLWEFSSTSTLHTSCSIKMSKANESSNLLLALVHPYWACSTRVGLWMDHSQTLLWKLDFLLEGLCLWKGRSPWLFQPWTSHLQQSMAQCAASSFHRCWSCLQKKNTLTHKILTRILSKPSTRSISLTQNIVILLHSIEGNLDSLTYPIHWTGIIKVSTINAESIN